MHILDGCEQFCVVGFCIFSCLSSKHFFTLDNSKSNTCALDWGIQSAVYFINNAAGGHKQPNPRQAQQFCSWVTVSPALQAKSGGEASRHERARQQTVTDKHAFPCLSQGGSMPPLQVRKQTVIYRAQQRRWNLELTQDTVRRVSTAPDRCLRALQQHRGSLLGFFCQWKSQWSLDQTRANYGPGAMRGP